MYLPDVPKDRFPAFDCDSEPVIAKSLPVPAGPPPDRSMLFEFR